MSLSVLLIKKNKSRLIFNKYQKATIKLKQTINTKELYYMDKIEFADENLERKPWKSDSYWVSHFNYAPEIEENFNRPSKIIVHDSTLRDGEQGPGISFNKEQKINIAREASWYFIGELAMDWPF